MLVPALHGHAAGAAGHLHASGDHTLTLAHVASGQDDVINDDVVAHGQGVHDAEVHAEAFVPGAESSELGAQDDLPVAWESAAWVVIAIVALGWSPAAGPASAVDRTQEARPRVRGSPVARHEVTRI